MKPDMVFYQQYAIPYFGILSLAARLQHRGYKVDVVIESLEDDPLKTLKELQPKLIGISVLSPEHKWLIKTSKAIHRELPDATIIVGGVHAMLYPEEILSSADVDIVCHSEGEDVLLRVMTELKKHAPDWSAIPGLSYRVEKDAIKTNERAQLVPYNDEIIEDQTFYYRRYPQLAKDAALRFISSRGCPYQCSFCYNAILKDFFRDKGVYVRQKSVENFIQEIALLCRKYPPESIFFYDDLFTYNKKWLRPFLEAYKKEINIPFMCTTRANLMDEDTASMLAKAGCRTISFGIETGNYEIRKNILKKNISDDKILSCGDAVSKYGIKIQTANMFCLPDETLEDAYKTIEINIKAKTDFAFTALFMPFPKTEITNYCIKQGYLKDDYSLKDLPPSFLNDSVLDIPDKDAIKNIHRLAFFFIRWPWFFRLSKNTVSYTFLNPLFQYIFILGTFLRHKQERGISFWAALRYAWRLRGSF
jgi:radical SAM superfamily enzyme YgiQ (UPF0313 family)